MKMKANAPRGKDLRDACASLTLKSSGGLHELDEALLAMLFQALEKRRAMLYVELDRIVRDIAKGRTHRH
jgi:hypothetical protein